MGALVTLNTDNGKTKLHEYLNYSLPIELRRMVTTSDVDISQAIGTCLVRMGEDGHVTSGIAGRWQVAPGGAHIDFHIDKKARWSDGSAITAQDVVASFRDTKAHFKKNIPSVFESYSEMEALTPDLLRVHLVSGVTAAAFLPKLVEPTFGIIKIVNWVPSIKVTSGPYSVQSVDEKELVLEVNPHWVFYTPDMISEIHLRRSDSFVSAATLLHDKWPDMVNLITGITKSELSKLPPGYSSFRLNENRLLNLRFAGRGSLEETRALFGFLRAQVDFKNIADLFENGNVARQVYPASLPLHSGEPRVKGVTMQQLQAVWQKPEVRVAYSLPRMQPEIVQAFDQLLKSALPFKIELIGLSQKEVNEVHQSRKYDLLFGSVGVGDENLDGALSYYIEQEPVHFPSDKTAKGNFVARLKAIRLSQGDQAAAFRQLVQDAVEENYFLPIAHFSTTFVARQEVDFAQVPKRGQIVPFSSIRRSK